MNILPIIAGGAALLLLSGKKKKKPSSGDTNTNGNGAIKIDPKKIDPKVDPDKSDVGSIELKADRGPTPDPCVAEFYSQSATSLAPELAQNISAKANAIYGNDPVFFISQAAQLQAYEMLAVHMVNNPGQNNAVVDVSEAMAPGCDWFREDPPAAQLAFVDSIGKMAQIVSADMPEGVGHRHPWENNIPILRDGQEIVVNDTHIVGIMLPEGDGTPYVDAWPSEPMYEVDSLGMAQQKVEVSPGVYQYKSLYVIRPIMGPIGKEHESINVKVYARRAGSDEEFESVIVVMRHNFDED